MRLDFATWRAGASSLFVRMALILLAGLIAVQLASFWLQWDERASVVAQALVYQYATLGHLDAFLPKIIAHYRTKRDVMMESFAEYLPAGEARFTKPEGGFFFWLETPNIPVDALFDHAIARNVAVVKGVPFYPNGDGGDHHCRVCFTFASADAIREGVKRLAASVVKEMERAGVLEEVPATP